MPEYYVRFEDNTKGVVEATSKEDALFVKPAYPQVVEVYGSVPYPFCMHPEKCVGRGACPRSYSCSE